MNYDEMNQKIKKESEKLEIPDSLQPKQIESMLESQKPSHKPWWKRLYIIAPALTAAAALFALTIIPGSNPVKELVPNFTDSEFAKTEPAIATAGSYGELYKAFSAYQKKLFAQQDMYVMEEPAMGAEMEKNQTSDAAAPSTTENDFSETNSQVTGVDEGDIVKTDGTYLYIMSSDFQSLSIVKADGSSITPISQINLNPDLSKTGSTYSYSQFTEFYLEGDRLVLIQTGGTTISPIEENSAKVAADEIANDYYNYKDTTLISIYDIQDRSNPVHLNTLSQDGSYGSSRKTEGFLYVFSYYYVYLNEQGEKEVNTYVPYTEDSAIPTTCIYIPESINSTGYLVVTSIDINSPDGFTDESAVVASPASYYVSAENIYVTSSSYDGDSDSEIMKFSYKDGKITPVADSTVPGVINNQFSLDEYNGYLRIVTTMYKTTSQLEDNIAAKISWWNPVSTGNSLYVLDHSLNIVGKIENLAPGEQIYSARFMGDTGYFVTFERVDPLFSVDLSNPADPKIIGELKITGFSSYLHFYKNDLLLGIGFEADAETGRTTGVKLSMFDIATPSDAQEIDKYVMPESSYTPAAYDHKSVLINPEKNIIGFMAQVEKNGHMNPTSSGYEFYQEYMTFSYDEEKGFVKNIGHKIETDYDNYYYTNPRGLFIGDYLYIIESASKIAVYDLTNNTQLTTWNTN